MKKNKKFLFDNKARIPFSVIGIFLILGSSFTSVYITKLETDKSEEIAISIDFNEIENLLRLAESDMNSALNSVALKAIEKIGNRTIIDAYSTAFGDNAEDVLKNMIREFIMEELNIYLTSSYLYDFFNNGKYSVNIIIPKNEKYPISSWDQISFKKLDMQLIRPSSIPLITPPQKINVEVYWQLSIPIKVEIKKLSFKDISKTITIKKIDINSIITSRYLLLKNLVDKEYYKTINDIHELWSYTTILSNIYTLARGYKHYSSGKPENVVDNKHLALIVNSGLLFEQSYTFGAVDPLALIQFTNQSYKTLKNNNKKSYCDIFNSDLSNPDGLQINTSDISEGSANTDSGQPYDEIIDQYLDIDLADIAESILFSNNKIVINFEKPSGQKYSVTLTYPYTNEDISNTILHYSKQGYSFLDIEKAGLFKNQTTINKIKEIITSIYTAKIKTKITRDPAPKIILGEHDSYTIDNGSGKWFLRSFDLIEITNKPLKGLIKPICCIYKELYNIELARIHNWSKKINDEWYHYSTIDIKKEENVKFEIVLNYYSKYKNSKNDVKDILYENTIVNDLNLEDSLDNYKNNYYTPNFNDLIISNSGNYFTEDIQGCVASWVESEAWDSLCWILEEIKKIKTDPTLNSKNYPNTFKLLELVKDDLLSKYNSSVNSLLDKSSYITNNMFISTGKKSVFCIRDWYINKVETELNNVFSQIYNMINEKINDASSGKGFNFDNIKETIEGEGMELLKNQFTIPFGFDMDLNRVKKGEIEWNEKTRLAVDQFPEYLTPFEETEYEGKKIQTMGIKNTCILGPTGLPILPPTPVTPWIITINLWLIEVKGEYCEFKVIDTRDETNFNAFFGHNPQIYIRREEDIYNIFNSLKVGRNTRLSYGFTTMSFGVVPSWGFMLGDWGDYCEEDGWS